MDGNAHTSLDALQKEYGEVSSLFKLLTEIRFKLLGFLPIASAVTFSLATAIPSAAASKGVTTSGLRLLFSLFGLAVTTGVAVYNERNNQLYNALVGRAADIERKLGLHGGAFANRPGSWLTINLLGIKLKVDHGTGVGTIYAACFALWLVGVYTAAIEIGIYVYNPALFGGQVGGDALWVYVVSLVLAMISTYLPMRFIKRQRENRERRMRELAAIAVNELLSLNLTRATEDSRFIARCAELGSIDASTVRARARFYLDLDKMSLQNYMPLAPDRLAMSHFLSLLTDLPPQWIFDCATNRRGALRVKLIE